jgi:hypothetical protein
MKKAAITALFLSSIPFQANEEYTIEEAEYIIEEIAFDGCLQTRARFLGLLLAELLVMAKVTHSGRANGYEKPAKVSPL